MQSEAKKSAHLLHCKGSQGFMQGESPGLGVARLHSSMPSGSDVPSHLPTSPTHACDLLLALGTAGCIAHIIAGRAEDGTLLLKEATFFQDRPTLAAHKLLRVVCVAQCHQVTAPEGEARVVRGSIYK